MLKLIHAINMQFENVKDYIDNRIKEFNNGEPIWEDMSKDELTLDDASLDDIMNLDWEIERQIEKDEKLMEKCSDTWY